MPVVISDASPIHYLVLNPKLTRLVTVDNTALHLYNPAADKTLAFIHELHQIRRTCPEE